MGIKDISWNVSEEEYRKDKSLSYSIIAKYDREGFECLPKLFESIETPSLLFGSAVDTLITEPMNFDNLFVISPDFKITESLEEIARYLAKEHSDFNSVDDIPDSLLSEVGERFNYYSNPKFKNLRVKNIKEGCNELFQFIKKSEGKKVISNKVFKDVRECVEKLNSSKYTSHFFKKNPFSNMEYHNQLKFKGEYEGIPIRCMIDLLIIDHDRKLIIPIDLKTSYKPEYTFYESFIKWKYYHQSNLYTYLLKQNIEKDEVLRDYTITDYLFVVISNNTRTPMVWSDNTNKSIVSLSTKEGELPNWRTVIKELNNYLKKDTTPEYPDWVKPINKLREFYE